MELDRKVVRVLSGSVQHVAITRSSATSITLSIIVGFIPPLIPFVMILRVAGSPEALPAWQIIVSLGLGIGTVAFMLWMCARIFRIGVLMQGKPPSPMELLRWIRYR